MKSIFILQSNVTKITSELELQVLLREISLSQKVTFTIGSTQLGHPAHAVCNYFLYDFCMSSKNQVQNSSKTCLYLNHFLN